MNLYVWNRVDGASSNYHDDGGIVAIADSLTRAREMIAEATKDKYSENRPECGALSKEPDIERGCDGPEFLAIHPDAGCC